MAVDLAELELEEDEVAVQQASLVFGADDRIENGAATGAIKTWADSVAILVSDDKLSCSNGTCPLQRQAWTIDFQTGSRLCSNVRFRGQSTLTFGPPLQGGFCTGFLVGPDLIASAAHCPVFGRSCEATKFVFGWTAAANGGSVPTSVPASNVYSCIDVWNGNYFANNDDDWVVYKLDRPVSGARAPFQVRHAGTVAANVQVGLIGHPLGVPQKISPVGNTTSTGNSFWFGNNLDMFEVNSGSPVFDRATGVVEGIQIRGAGVPHFVAGTDASGACVRENVCSTTAGCTGGDFGKAFRIARASDFIPLTPAQISVVTEPITI